MITIDSRYNGPATSANGGVAAGLLADHVGRPSTVRFMAPIPLDTPLGVTTNDDDGKVVVMAGDVRVATIRPTPTIDVGDDLPLPSADEVARAEATWSAFVRQRHPYPTCFGCGPERARGDGLGLRPGAVPALDVHAASWRPVGDVPTWMVWAAMDCGSAGPLLATLGDDEAVVTGELAVSIQRDTPVPGTGVSLFDGRDLVIVSRAVEREGARTVVVAQLVDRASGVRLASARSTWFTIPKELAP